MSGGVDSSVAAALLARAGHEVIGVTLRLLPRGGEGFGCCGSPEDVLIAKRSADQVGIPHYVLDYSPDFDRDVVDYFVNSYVAGETPNPCLACNRHIKFDKLKKFAQTVEATYLATGHYARIHEDAGRYRLYEAVDPTKDQSYVLFNFNQEGLGSTLFPVGEVPKTEIRRLAREFGLPNADKKDSQEICFVPNKDYRSFVKIRLEEKQAQGVGTAQPGPIRDSAGRMVGQHEGVAFYTVGQRRGLGLSGSEPLYVTRLDPETNTVVVGSDQENLSAGLKAEKINWISGAPPALHFSAHVKIRYKHEPVPAQVRLNGEGIEVLFETPQRAVTKGQAAVIYQWDAARNAREILGGGKITGPHT